MSEWIDSRHLLDSSGFHVPTALPFYLLGAHEWLNWNPGCQFSLRNSLLILKEEEVMLGGKSFSLNPCRITKNKFMTMSAVFMSSFSFEIYVVRLAVDWGMLVNQYRWRCWLNPGLFFFFPYSSLAFSMCSSGLGATGCCLTSAWWRCAYCNQCDLMCYSQDLRNWVKRGRQRKNRTVSKEFDVVFNPLKAHKC